MSASVKTLLIGAAIALAAAIFTLQVARAGEYHHLPFMPFNAYEADVGSVLGDDDRDEIASYTRARAYGSELDAAVSTARGMARDYLDTDLGGLFDDDE